MNKDEKKLHYEEITPKYTSGMKLLILNLILMLASVGLFVYAIIEKSSGAYGIYGLLMIALIVISAIYFGLIGPILFAGLKILKPNEALVLTLFGKYYGTLKGEGFFFVNPFVTAFHPVVETPPVAATTSDMLAAQGKASLQGVKRASKIISLKTMTLHNDKQKINDELGNPIIIGIVVIWKVVNTAKAAFNVDNYTEYLSIQCDSALRNIVRLYPYDSENENQEKSLRGSSQEVAEKLKAEIQNAVEIAGLEIIEARITHLAYAPEIAAAMLQRQQASAIIDARQMIVEGAVGMVEMALEKLNENNVVHLDEERKAAMVSNLLVVLCGNKDAQPIVNSGSIY
ncbi:SPFH domain-containing protein [Anoxybacterium hadale]|uniref:SPFH domain-containing protein n=2 Tax=Anoxybacterium hadale TaxID=3408580 RepID=A0ACD1AHE2_9FIRM|nr:SPFH domain-containing protein [Clostridiales bacterium]